MSRPRADAGLQVIDCGPRLIHARDPWQHGPFDALVREEDTYGVLSADPVVRMPTDHPIRIMTALHGQRPLAPGSVQLREGRPLLIRAVVHDLDQEPGSRERWIVEALERVLAVCAERHLHRVCCEPLGETHGHRHRGRFADCLERCSDPGSTRWPQLIVVAPGRI